RKRVKMHSDLILRKLADWNHAGNEHSTLTILDDGWETRITAIESRTMVCRAWEVSMRSTAGNREAPVEPWALRVAAGVTSLPGGLQIVEVDRAANMALLRNRPEPISSQGPAHYFELRLLGTHEAKLAHYQA